MRLDARGTPVSCDNVTALELYEAALREFQSYEGDAVATVDRALVEQPDFVLGHAFKAAVLSAFGERRFSRIAAESVAAAEALIASSPANANERERGLVTAARRLVAGDWAGGCAAYDRVLVDHPRDALAIQTAHLFDFYRGDALNLRNRMTRVLRHWSPSVPGWSFVLGMQAFGLEECNQYPEAEGAARRALAFEPKDGWAVHAAVHCMEMNRRVEEGIEWLETRTVDWMSSGFAFHLWWHLALFHLERGDDARVLELYDGRIYPERSDVSLQLVDATSLLYRLHLLGVDVRSRMAQLADVWEGKLDSEQGFYAFNDMHAMMAFAVARHEAAANRVVEGAASSVGGEVGLPVVRSILAFEQGRYDDAIELLEPVRDLAHHFGGSHAQRDVLRLLLIAAAHRADRSNLGRHYLSERPGRAPGPRGRCV